MEAIIARSDNFVIGYRGTIPWQCTEDLKFFKQFTMGKTLVVGRKTYMKLPTLPGRKLLVLTTDTTLRTIKENVTFVTDVSLIPNDVVICGGYEIYELFQDKIDKLIVSVIHQNVKGDTVFNKAWLTRYKSAKIVHASKQCTITEYSL